MELGDRIAAWRKWRGLTQAHLAKAAGITVSAVSRCESGETAPTQAHLKAFVARLGISMAKFWGRAPRLRASKVAA